MQETCLYYSKNNYYFTYFEIEIYYNGSNNSNNKSFVDIEMQQIVILKSIYNIILQENLNNFKNLILLIICKLDYFYNLSFKQKNFFESINSTFKFLVPFLFLFYFELEIFFMIKKF